MRAGSSQSCAHRTCVGRGCRLHRKHTDSVRANSYSSLPASPVPGAPTGWARAEGGRVSSGDPGSAVRPGMRPVPVLSLQTLPAHRLDQASAGQGAREDPGCGCCPAGALCGLCPSWHRPLQRHHHPSFGCQVREVTRAKEQNWLPAHRLGSSPVTPPVPGCALRGQ